MKLDFNFPIKNVFGEVIIDNGEEVCMYKVLASTIMSPAVKIGDTSKKYVLATTIAKNKEIEVDAADLKLIKEISNLQDAFTPIVQAQLLEYIETVK